MYKFAERILDAVYNGDVELLKVLFSCDFLRANDLFENDTVSILHLVARRPCVDYKYVINTLLEYGVRLDCGMPYTPLEEAIIYKNFSTAHYLENLGGTYCSDELTNLNEYQSYKMSYSINF